VQKIQATSRRAAAEDHWSLNPFTATQKQPGFAQMMFQRFLGAEFPCVDQAYSI